MVMNIVFRISVLYKFPEVGAPTSDGGMPREIFNANCTKMKEIVP